MILHNETSFQAGDEGAVDGRSVYDRMNILVRRRPKENNFKAVLSTLRNMMEGGIAFPPWLSEVFLGFGSPDQATYYSLPDQLPHVDCHDTFVDEGHLRKSFSSHKVEVQEATIPNNVVPAYRVSIPRGVAPGKTQAYGNHDRANTMECEEASPNEDFASMTVVELRRHLSEKGLSTSGKKAELIERLQSLPTEVFPIPCFALLYQTFVSRNRRHRNQDLLSRASRTFQEVWRFTLLIPGTMFASLLSRYGRLVSSNGFVY